MNEYRERLLSENGIFKPEKELTSFHWFELSESTSLSTEFIREFSDELHWLIVSMSQILSDEIIDEFKNHINFHKYFFHNIVEYKIIKRYIYKTYFRNVEHFKSDHLIDLQKQKIQKLLDIKYMFN